jgi:hypothetical protein
MALRMFSPNTPVFPYLTHTPVVIDSLIQSSPCVNSVTQIVVKYLLKMTCSSLLQHCCISICLDFINIANKASCSIALKGSTTFLPYATSNIVANHYQPLGTNPSQFNRYLTFNQFHKARYTTTSFVHRLFSDLQSGSTLI